MIPIKFKSILKITGVILLLMAAFFIVCTPVALFHSEPVMPFINSAIATIIPGLLLYFLTPSSIHERMSTREGYLSVTLSWLAMTISGTLPYFFSGTITDFFHAWFESVSGFTTTGSSIFTDVESLPISILFWRSFTHWIGGAGIILLAIIVLPSLKVGGYNLFSLESSVKEKVMPKTKAFAVLFLLVYVSLTVFEIGLLLAGGLGLFESICTSFGTVATGGFSIRNTSLTTFSPYLQYVVAVFMWLSAASYVLYYFLIKREFNKIRKNDEFRFYIAFTAISIVSVTLLLFFFTDRSLGLSFRHSFFQVIAQITTTGFATSDYMKWPAAALFIMFLLLFAGGSTGSSTGGIKMARHFIALRNLKSVFLRINHPNVIHLIKFNGRVIPEGINALMLLFIVLYIIIFLAGSILIAMTGIPVAEAAGASATAMSNVGPGLGASGNMGNYAHFNDFSLTTMSLLMIIGRLEIFTILAIFTRPFWKG